MLEQETRQQIRDMLERFVAEELIPAEAEMAANKAVPDHLITKMADLSLESIMVSGPMASWSMAATSNARATFPGWHPGKKLRLSV